MTRLLESAQPACTSESERPVAHFTAALLKVASRCNLDCDYCYVYKHADQSWRERPHFMSDAVIEQFGHRLREYRDFHKLEEFSITFHGGEPLLFGAARLATAAKKIGDIVGPAVKLDFSLQSNGTLLTEEVIDALESADIAVSLSLDGPREVHDRHRPAHGGASTFDATLVAVQRLTARNSRIFSGVIAVIDPEVPPRDLFEFFAPLQLPRLDLLLPDATYERPPHGRATQPMLYVNWVKEALSTWFTDFSSLPIRWFDALLGSRLGIASPTDAMGLGAVSLLVIDTDGSYTDHDVFKITMPSGGMLNRHLTNASFEEIGQHEAIREHGFRLTLPGLASECRSCPVVEACGGGSVMHRWHPQRKLNAPSIYCGEIFGALETSTELIRKSFSSSYETLTSEYVDFTSGDSFTAKCRRWRAATESRANNAAKCLGLQRKNESAAAMLLAEQYESARLADHGKISFDGQWLNSIRVHSDDKRLVAPFLSTVRVLSSRSKEVQHGITALKAVENLLAVVHRSLPESFAALISDVIFVQSTVESTDHIFSFSDDTAPNVLYIAPSAGDTLLRPDDLGDSLLHEFLHQVLYQMEREAPMLMDKVYPRFPAPWREGMRPSGGFFHGTFVFAGLSQYWAALARAGLSIIDRDKAIDNSERFANQAIYGINSLRQFALLTASGQKLLDQLAARMGLRETRRPAPGLSTTCYTGSYESETPRDVARRAPTPEISPAR